MAYTSYPDGSVRHDETGVYFTPDPSSGLAEQADYRAWLQAGNAPTPAPTPVPPIRQQAGNVFLGAIADLGWWAWFDQGAAAQAAAKPTEKPLDQRYWQSISKSDTVLVCDAKLLRVARAAEAVRVAASGQPAPAQPVITLSAVMDHGDAMARAG